MERKLVLISVMVILFTSLFDVEFRVERVKASDTIYIRADGSIDPPTSNITTVNNVTYTFTDNNYYEIVVERNNITIDGKGYTLQGRGIPLLAFSKGISLSGKNNITIKNMEIRSFNYGIWLSLSSNDNSIYGNNITNNDAGVSLESSSNFNIISRNNITSNNGYGIYLYFSSNNTISGNNITNNGYSVYLSLSSNNTISGNNITSNNGYGVIIFFSSSNTVSGNYITNSVDGISILSSSNYNKVSGNNITNNDYGIRLSYSSNNTVYQNNFINNSQGILSGSANNKWDNGCEGNYWSNYTGADANHDGIGDSPHVLDMNNTDNAPLMGPFNGFNTSLGKPVNVISNSTIEDFEYESPGTIRFSVSNMTENQTHGFCRVTIPHDVLSPPYNVTVNGLSPTHVNYTLHDNGTHSWIYFEYEHSTSEVIIIPEFPFFEILPLLMILMSIVILAYKRKHIIET